MPFTKCLTPFALTLLYYYAFALILESRNTKRKRSKLFGNNAALKNVNFVVKKGQTIGFLGPSGSGKTTTIKILTAQLLATAGEVKVFDQPVRKLKNPSYMKRIGVLTDNSGLYERLSIYDNLALYCDIYGVDKGRDEEVLK